MTASEDRHLKILNDNTAVVQSTNNMGSCKSISRDSEVRNIWGWAIMRKQIIMAAHIRGIIIVEEDAESRMSKTKTEWKLNEPCFHSILSHFRGNPSEDLFALRTDVQPPTFFSYRPDPNAKVINAFAKKWNPVVLSFYCLVLENIQR